MLCSLVFCAESPAAGDHPAPVIDGLAWLGSVVGQCRVIQCLSAASVVNIIVKWSSKLCSIG